jgi:hypothetical protein
MSDVYVVFANIKRFQHLLRECKDQRLRRTIENLLHEERRKLERPISAKRLPS